MGPLLVLVCPCFRENVIVTCKIIYASAVSVLTMPPLRHAQVNFPSTSLRGVIKKPIIKRVIEETRKTNRNDTLRYKNKDKSNTRTPLVVTYHPDLPPLAQIVNKHFSILQTNDKLKQVFPEPPLISYRRPKNLRDLIVRAKLPSDAPEETNVIGSHPCQSSRCKNCKNMTQTNTFTSNTTKQTFKIRESITCTTINVIYLIECTFCGIQYVGETSKKIQDRMRGHRSDIKCKRTDANHPVACILISLDTHLNILRLLGLNTASTNRTHTDLIGRIIGSINCAHSHPWD